MAIASLTVAQSCIFEDREHCPVYLTLDFSGVPEEVGNVLLFLEHEDGYLYRDTVYSRDFRSTYEIPVQKGRYHVAAFGNISEMVFDRGYCVTPGRQADSLYTCFHTASYTGDLAADTINMAKDHIGLHIRVLGRAEDPDSIFVRIESSSVGYSLYGDIIGGTYIHVPEAAHIAEDDAGYYEFSSRILRQKEEDLTRKYAPWTTAPTRLSRPSSGCKTAGSRYSHGQRESRRCLPDNRLCTLQHDGKSGRLV